MTQKITANISETKFEDIEPNVRKGKKGGSVKADFLCGGAQEELKIATFTEAPFMLKSDFWNNKYFSQIFAQ